MRITFNRQRLHASILSAMRIYGIPMELRGADLLRGTIIGMIDHPEYNAEKAVARASEMCTMTGEEVSTERGFREVAEVLLYAASNSNHKKVEDILEIDELSEKQEEKIHSFVAKGVNEMIFTIQKDFCYSKAVNYLSNRFDLREMGVDLLKNMIFKRLVDQNSTKESLESLYEYAYRGTFGENPPEEKAKLIATIGEYTRNFIGPCESAYLYSQYAAEEIEKEESQA